ncbi:MAG: HupE/UreJ family protein [Congregibacter sp.]
MCRTFFARAFAALVLLVLGNMALADVFRPAYLEMQQIDEQHYKVLWRLPALSDQRRLSAKLVFPDKTNIVGDVRGMLFDNAWEERYTLRTTNSLIGQQIRIEGILGGATDVIVRIERADGTTQLERLKPSQPQFTVTASPGSGEIAWDYFVLGVEHILGGIDHLLFVLALLLLVRNRRRLLLTITAFTVAHSITLICASLGWISLPGPPVEAAIALSIVFVATEVVHEQRGRISSTAQAPWLVAFAFGLLHGLGFAGALEEIGLPETAVPVALLMFNVGVEAGQLLFVAAMVALSAILGRFTRTSYSAASQTISYVIGSIAAFWTLERVAAFAR